MMQAIAHGSKPKSGHGPSQKIAKEFVAADHARGAAKLPERVGHAIVQGKSAKEIT
jgi:hypothetical protein